ncbi:MAG: amino acid adenylation domain-containing protein [Oscillospiraceae bacterium]|nr:amino acid adenylation domain-containing protein [Oscillospiraceae bacterium]
MMINVLEYLEQTIKNIADPDKPAFIGNALAQGNEALTFRQLYDMSRSCGSYLIENGINKQPVAVFMEKSPDMIAAFFGVVFGGNYYVPLDCDIPAFRIRMILKAVNPSLIICDDVTAPLVREWGLESSGESAADREPICNAADGEQKYQTVKFCEITSHLADEKALAAARAKAIDTDPLYVVFTSGSTGVPKGVVASHRNVIDYIENLSAVLKIDSGTVFGNQSPLYLDACLKEIYPTVKFGATTYLIPKSLFMFPLKLIEYINEHKINTVCWVSSSLSLIAGVGALGIEVPRSLCRIAFGGEVFAAKYYNQWREALPEALFVHLYGPTEATGMSAYYVADRTLKDGKSIPIGTPFANTDIILLDDNGELCKDGEIGEICIRGAGLTLGYFGDPDKTAASFVQNPLSPFPDTIYKTGDLGRREKDGNLYYISRRDLQIKLMGHRIELAEIELLAASCENVELTCAVFDGKSNKIILFYMGKDASRASLKAFLKANLPRYMLPHTVIQIGDIPRTSGGKLDRTALLEKYRSGGFG